MKKQVFNEKQIGFLLVALSGILSGFIVFSGQVFANLGLSLFELAILPFIFSLPLLAPFVFQKKFFPKKKYWALLLVYGLIAAGAVFCQFGGVVFGASVAVVVLLLYAQPLWTILISAIFLKEKVNKFQLFACVLVLIGVFLLVDPSNLFSSKSWLGVITALIGGVFLSLWIIIGRHASKSGIAPISIKFFETLVAIIVTFLAYPILLLFTTAPVVVRFSLNLPLWFWALLIGYNILFYTGNHLIYYLGSKRISAINSGLLMLLEPVVGTILAAVFLAQAVTLPVVIGGALILLANYLVVTKA